ncbi:Uncharacterized protein GBIM_07526, partial [Gryllus bimaculatus]
TLAEPLRRLQRQVESAARQAAAGAGPALATLEEPVRELQQRIAAVQHRAVLESGVVTDAAAPSVLQETSRLPQSEVESLSALEKIVAPLQQLEAGLAQLQRQQAKMGGERARSPEVRRALLASLEQLSQPVQELRREMSALNARAGREAEVAYGKANVTALHLLQAPLQAFAHGLEDLERVKSGVVREEETAQRLGTLHKVKESVRTLHVKVAAIEQCTKTEAAKEKAGVEVLGGLRSPLAELTHGLKFVEDQIVTTALEEALPDISTIAAIGGLANPIESLKSGLEAVETLTLEQLDEPKAKKARAAAGKVITQAVQELKKEIAVVQQQAVLESGALSISEAPSVLEVLFKPLQKLQRCLVTVEESKLTALQRAKTIEVGAVLALEDVAQAAQDLTTNIDESLQKMEATATGAAELNVAQSGSAGAAVATLAAVHELARPLRALATSRSKARKPKATAPVQVQVALEAPPLSQAQCASLLEALAAPVQQLQRGLAVATEQLVLEAVSETQAAACQVVRALQAQAEQLQRGVAQVQQQAAQDAVEAFAAPTHELHKALAQVQHVVALTASAESLTEKTALSALQTLASPVQELRLYVAQVESQVAFEGGDRSLAEGSQLSLSALQTLAQPLRALDHGVAMVQEVALMEPATGSLSEQAQLSALQTLAEPLQAVRSSVQHLEQMVLEPRPDSLTEHIDPQQLLALAQPLEEVQRGLAQAQQAAVLEAGGTLSPEASASALATLARPLLELQRGLAQLEAQVALEGEASQMSERTTASGLATLAESAREPARAVAAALQHQLVEAPDASLADAPSLAALHTLAQPLRELQQHLVQAQQQMMEARAEDMSECTAMTQLHTLAAPVHELQLALAQVHQQVLEAGLEPMSERTDVELLKTIAAPVRQIHMFIAQVQQAAAHTESVKLLPDTQMQSILEALAAPVHQLHTTIAAIQQPTLLEAADIFMAVAALEAVAAAPLESLGAAQVSAGDAVSQLQTLAQPLLDVQAGIQQLAQVALEAPAQEMATLRSQLQPSQLQALAHAIQEAQRGLVQLQVVALEGEAAPLPPLAPEAAKRCIQNVYFSIAFVNTHFDLLKARLLFLKQYKYSLVEFITEKFIISSLMNNVLFVMNIPFTIQSSALHILNDIIFEKGRRSGRDGVRHVSADLQCYKPVDAIQVEGGDPLALQALEWGEAAEDTLLDDLPTLASSVSASASARAALRVAQPLALEALEGDAHTLSDESEGRFGDFASAAQQLTEPSAGGGGGGHPLALHVRPPPTLARLAE